MDAPKDRKFITGDAPVVSVAHLENGRVQLGVNYAHPTFQVHFALSPDVCLFITKVRVTGRAEASAQDMDELNRLTAFMANRFVFFKEDSAIVRKQCEDSRFTYNAPKINPEELAARIDWQKKHGKDVPFPEPVG